MSSAQYRELWYRMPMWKRLMHQIWWRAESIACAVLGQRGPGERLVIKSLCAERDEASRSYRTHIVRETIEPDDRVAKLEHEKEQIKVLAAKAVRAGERPASIQIG